MAQERKKKNDCFYLWEYVIKVCTVLCYDKFEIVWFMYSHALWRGWVDSGDEKER